MSSAGIWNALIRTHHITSRKKVTKLKQAASTNAVFVLLRSGASPGVMYVEGAQKGVEEWVGIVQVCFLKQFRGKAVAVLKCRQRLRYKDYQLASRPQAVKREQDPDFKAETVSTGGFFETQSVKDFGQQMQQRGVFSWWRTAMGYAGQEGHL